ncbi:hypothetical protein GT003_12080 [Paenibacillus sacheonensis]|uniref:Uncharacterized protein n=1 Tax=Paenibacillus sacheonensis TaxID=742054 RepID=A0A7X4YNQ7_9BACL|nr:hypothetical protein [Paenibacillus sacheonensis]NBC69733.1 hypothetical protein [Paenibacillus sacheonensis]
MKHRKAAEVIPFLSTYIAKREQEIAEIEQMVERYERRRLQEERTYQSMSTLRRLLSGKKPAHHVAVEYIHYVKRPMEKVRLLRLEIEQARKILNTSDPSEIITVSSEMEDELN